MDLKKLIVEYLQKAKLMQLATSKENQPWVCNVYFAFDDNFNIYWISKPERRHSEEVRNNTKVAGAIVLPHTPGDDVRGIQFQGKAYELSGKDAEDGIKVYAKRYDMPQERVEKILDGSDGHMIYKIKVDTIVLFDEVNFPKNPRQEYKV